VVFRLSGVGNFNWRVLQLSAIILLEHILLFSRIAIVDVQVFVTLVAETAKSKGVPEAEIWEVVMTQWWNRVSLFTVGRSFGALTGEPSSITCQSHGTGS